VTPYFRPSALLYSYEEARLRNTRSFANVVEPTLEAKDCGSRSLHRWSATSHHAELGSRPPVEYLSQQFVR